jgi:hypothetical protein
MDKIDSILERYFGYLRKYVNVLNVNTGEEVKDGKKTGRRAIVVYVSRKLKLDELKEKDRLPEEIENIPVDVVELSSDFELGDTKPSRLKPTVQKLISGGVRKHEE